MKTVKIILLSTAVLLFMAGQGFSQNASSSDNKTTPAKPSTGIEQGKFVDKNNNGICDNFEAREKSGKCANFTDNDGDGKCDNCKKMTNCAKNSNCCGQGCQTKAGKGCCGQGQGNMHQHRHGCMNGNTTNPAPEKSTDQKK
jgi:hypothetical protein